MPRNEFKFDAALPHPIRWSVGENKYDTEGDWPSQLGLQIPTESITPFCNYLMSLLDEEGKISTGKVWDHDKKAEVEVDVVWINGKGKDGQYGSFGNINPQKTEAQRQAQDVRNFPQTSEEIPF